MTASAALCPHEHSDQDATEKNIADSLNSYATTTACCHALAHTVLNPITQPPEAWWLDLKTDFTEAQAHAQRWLTDIAPRLGTKVPQTIVEYGDTFTAATGELLRIVSGPSISAQDRRDIVTIVESVLASAEAQASSIKTLRDDVKTLQNDLLADHQKLTRHQHNALTAAQAVTSEIVDLETRIAQLQNELSSARQNLMVSGIATGVAIFIAVAAFALAVATGGAGLIVAGAVGIVGLGVAATFTGVFNTKAMRLSDEVAAQQLLLDEKKRQAGALRGLVGSLSDLAKQIEAADAALLNVANDWATIYDNMEAVANSFRNRPSEESLVTIRFLVNTDTPRIKRLRCLAQNAQHMASSVQLQPLLQHPTLQQMY